MNLRFPLPDVTLKEVPATRAVEEPLYSTGYWQMNQREFAMQIEGVCSFYACDGKEIEYSTVNEPTPEAVELYLNGSVYGAILHQRQILPLHGSSFIFNGTGVIVCGEAGAGKSSLTASFVIDGAEFLTDDVTPLVISDETPFILSVSDRIKLWDNALEQLELSMDGLGRIAPETEKYYYSLSRGKAGLFPLKLVLILNISDNPGVTFREITGTEKVAAIRNELYRPEYLSGMRENESLYFKQIVNISRTVSVFSVSRHKAGLISQLKSDIERFLNQV